MVVARLKPDKYTYNIIADVAYEAGGVSDLQVTNLHHQSSSYKCSFVCSGSSAYFSLILFFQICIFLLFSLSCSCSDSVGGRTCEEKATWSALGLWSIQCFWFCRPLQTKCSSQESFQETTSTSGFWGASWRPRILPRWRTLGSKWLTVVGTNCTCPTISLLLPGVCFSIVCSSSHQTNNEAQFEYRWNLWMSPGIVPSVTVFNQLLDGCSLNGEFHNAIDIYESMQTSSCLPDRCSFVYLFSTVSNYAKKGAHYCT